MPEHINRMVDGTVSEAWQNKVHREMEVQEALLHAANKGEKPKDFEGTAEQFGQAVAQAYLQNYDRYMQSLGSHDTPDTGRDYREGHVGPALEIARKFAGLRPTDPTWNMREAEKEQYLAQNPDVAAELANPSTPITKFAR